MDINPAPFASLQHGRNIISLANAHAYQWGYADGSRRAGGVPPRVPDGWPDAWLDYTHRNSSRMAIQDAFIYWLAHATLPGLS
jgi:hypothetical protein